MENETSLIPDRGACVQMRPPLPDVWACVYQDNFLYKEITSLLLAGYAASKTCLLGWSAKDLLGLDIIDYAECR